MKKLFILSALVLGSTFFAKAQVELTPYAGYQFGSRTYLSNGQLKINDSEEFGLFLGFIVSPELIVEASYTNIPTDAYKEGGGLVQQNLGNVGINYFQLGIQSPKRINDRVDLFGLFSLGATSYVPENTLYNTRTLFSITAGGGVKIWLSDVVGIRLQGRFLMPLTWGGVSIGCGWGGGCGTGVSAGSAVFSGDLGGGLVFKLGS